MGGIVRTIFGGPSKSKQKSTSTSSSSSYNQAYGPLLGALGPTLGYTRAGGDMMGALLGVGGGGGSPTYSNPGYTQQPVGGGGYSGGSPGSYADNPRFRGEVMPLGRQNGGEESLLARLTGGVNNARNQGAFHGYSAQPAQQQPGGASQGSALENWANSGGMRFLRGEGVRAVEGSRAGRGMFLSGDTGRELMKFGQGLGSTYLNQYMDQLLNYAKLGQGNAGILASAGGVSQSQGTGQSSGSGQGEKKGLLPMIAGAIAGGA